MKLRKFFAVFFSALLLFFTLSPLSVSAATFRGGETVNVDESLKDLYVSGGTVDVAANTQNDLTVAGGTVRVEGDVQNSLLAGGGNVTVSGTVNNNARVAGGTVIFNAPIKNDLLVFGGTIELTKEASVGGDLIVSGGTIRIDGPISGNIWIHGGNVEINSTVGGNVYGGSIGKLSLGKNAVITGDLTYTSSQKASMAQGAQVKGQEHFTLAEKDTSSKEEASGIFAGLITVGAIYKVIVAILISLFFIWLLPKFFSNTNKVIVDEPLRAGLVGFAMLVLMPVLSAILLIFLWLGVASFLLYFLLLLFSVVVVYIFVGWYVLRWWYGRNKKQYTLDWKAGIVGPLLVTILWIIPVIGWVINFILWLLALGSLTLQLGEYITANREIKAKR